MTMDSIGMLRPRTVEGATVQLTAYLVKNPPAPNDPAAAEHRVALESLNIVANTLAPAVPAAAAAPPDSAERRSTRGISAPARAGANDPEGALLQEGDEEIHSGG